MKTWILTLIVLFMMAAPQAHAEPTVHDLRTTICADTSGIVCGSFVGAAVEAFDLGAAKVLNKNHAGVIVCIPPHISWFVEARQIMAILNEDLTLFPTDDQLPAVGAVAGAAIKLWPCRARLGIR
jgi:hypothetical protein